MCEAAPLELWDPREIVSLALCANDLKVDSVSLDRQQNHYKMKTYFFLTLGIIIRPGLF